MTIKSNLYVEKVSSEHPIAVWMLNDQLDYISLITETERAIENTSNWTVTGATPSLSTTDPANVPFPDSHVTKILGSVPVSTTNIVIESDFYTLLSEFNTAQANVAISGNIFVESVYANSISFGYKYFNGTSTIEVLETKLLTISDQGKWVFFSDTFDIPPTGATNIQLLFKINIFIGGGAPDYTFYMNGLTFGQWAEEFNESSLGLDLSSYSPPSGFIPGLNVIPAIPYGVSTENAYYVVNSNNLYAKNFGVPIVYGSSNVTKLYYNASGPSLVFPGYGFLNQKGKYNDYTAEMWVKINSDTSEPHRIFGPVFSNDGLYIEGPFLTFVINGQYSSHYVGEWYRPMLIHIRYIQNNLSVLLNGEQIINIPFIENNLVLPNEFDGSVNQDWLGFYAHPDITPLEIDSFALYSYSVANEVAKRRWVWGQGVIAPEQTGSALNAVTSFNDYTYSNYSVNYNYPDYAKWDQAFFSNVATTSRSLELPNYSLPIFNFKPVNISATYSSGGAPAATTFVISAANSSILVGQKVVGTGFAENTYVTNVSTTTITVSPAIVSQVSGTITFIPNAKTIENFYDDNKNIVLPTTTRTNMIINPSIESNLTSWASNSASAISRTTSQSYIGSASILLTSNGLGSFGPYNIGTTGRVPVTAGQVYTFSMYVKDINTTVNYRAGIEFYNSLTAGTNVGTIYGTSTAITTTGWTRVTVTATAPVGALGAVPTIYSASAPVSGRQAYFDSALMEQSSVLGSYFDGSYTLLGSNYNPVTTWTGTANASTSTLTYLSNQDDIDGHKFFSFRPNSSWNSIDSTAYFSEYGFLAEPVESFYGLFSSDGTATDQLLFKVENKITGEYLKAVLDSTTITYSAKFSGMSTEQPLGTKTITANQRFVAGINVPTLSQKSISGIRKFFSNESMLGIYMFGDNVDNTFSGRVYSFNFDGKYNNRNLASVNYADGFFDTTLSTANLVLGHTANYTVEAFEKYGEYFLDISVAGYWQDYMPLTYFGKYVTDFEGVQHYDLDMIQFNIDYPEPIETQSVELTQEWNYDDLYIWFRQDITRTYASLDSFAYTGWDDYAEMNLQTTQYQFYNTVDNYVRPYVSFQPIMTGASQSLLDLPNHVQARTNGIVDTETLIGQWETSAYEVVDGSIIFPPTIDKNNISIDFNNYALVYHLDFKAKATLQNKVRVRNLQLASQVLERASFTEMGTKFAVPVYPFTKIGFSYDLKAKNYTSTYKGSTPHLYLNRHSGWRIRKASDDLLERGISIPINFQEAPEFSIKGVQMWLRYSESAFPTVETRLFSLEYNGGVYDFYVISDSSTQRGFIYGKDRSANSIVAGIQYYINGSLVERPYLVNQEWLVLGVQFPKNVVFDNDVGRLNLNGPFTYNNVSAYLVTNLERAQTVVYRNWGQVADQIWDYWENSFSWGTMLVIDSESSGILNFGDIYQQYVGTNRVIIDDPTRGVLVNPERLRFYGDIAWTSGVRTPV